MLLMCLFFLLGIQEGKEPIIKLCESNATQDLVHNYEQLINKGVVENAFFFHKLYLLKEYRYRGVLESMLIKKDDIERFNTEWNNNSVYEILNNYHRILYNSLCVDSVYNRTYLENFLNTSKYINETEYDDYVAYSQKLFIKHPEDFILILNNRKDLKEFFLSEVLCFGEKVLEVVKKYQALFTERDKKHLKIIKQ